MNRILLDQQPIPPAMHAMLLEYRRVAYEEDRIVASDRSQFDDCDDVIIKQSKRRPDELGIFATRDLDARTILGDYQGKKLKSKKGLTDTSKLLGIWAYGKRNNKKYAAYDYFIDGNQGGNWLTLMQQELKDEAKANVENEQYWTSKHIEYVLTKDVKKGEELIVFNGTQTFDDRIPYKAFRGAECVTDKQCQRLNNVCHDQVCVEKKDRVVCRRNCLYYATRAGTVQPLMVQDGVCLVPLTIFTLEKLCADAPDTEEENAEDEDPDEPPSMTTQAIQNAEAEDERIRQLHLDRAMEKHGQGDVDINSDIAKLHLDRVMKRYGNTTAELDPHTVALRAKTMQIGSIVQCNNNKTFKIVSTKENERGDIVLVGDNEEALLSTCRLKGGANIDDHNIVDLMHLPDLHPNLYLGSIETVESLCKQTTVQEDSTHVFPNGETWRIVSMIDCNRPVFYQDTTFSDTIKDKSEAAKQTFLKRLAKASNKLTLALDQGKTLVNCHAGRNRSVSLIVYWAKQHKPNMDAKAIIQYIRDENQHRDYIRAREDTLSNYVFEEWLTGGQDDVRLVDEDGIIFLQVPPCESTTVVLEVSNHTITLATGHKVNKIALPPLQPYGSPGKVTTATLRVTGTNAAAEKTFKVTFDGKKKEISIQ